MSMEVRFENEDLEKLATDPKSDGGFSRDIVKAFRKRVQFIRSAKDERDFWAFRRVGFEKLKGARRGEYSMRLNDQFRLILKLESGDKGRIVVIKSIEDYH